DITRRCYTHAECSDGGPMREIGRSLWIAAWQLGKAPGFAVTVVLTLALGIGATTAVFSLVDGVLLRRLAYRDAERRGLGGGQLDCSGSQGVHGDWRDAARFFVSVAGGATGSGADLGAVEPDTGGTGGAARGILGLSHGGAVEGRRDTRAGGERRGPRGRRDY